MSAVLQPAGPVRSSLGSGRGELGRPLGRLLDAGARAARVVGVGLTRVGAFIVRLPGRVLLGLLWLYQRFISPLTPPSCRYYPSCSQYAVIAVRRHGALRGSWLAVRRLGRCHPWTAGGVDDVPPARETSAQHGPRRARSSTR